MFTKHPSLITVYQYLKCKIGIVTEYVVRRFYLALYLEPLGGAVGIVSRLRAGIAVRLPAEADDFSLHR